jgi:hypothetical protein
MAAMRQYSEHYPRYGARRTRFFLDAVDWFLVVIVQHVFGPERVCRCLLKRRVSAIVVKTENRM